jgi:hypothetical protein
MIRYTSLPLFDNNSNDVSAAIGEALARIANNCKRMTATRAEGLWKNAEGTVVREPVLYIEIHDGDMVSIEHILLNFKAAAKQDCVLLTTSKTAYHMVVADNSSVKRLCDDFGGCTLVDGTAISFENASFL